jgi:hypothetical protein
MLGTGPKEIQRWRRPALLTWPAMFQHEAADAVLFVTARGTWRTYPAGLTTSARGGKADFAVTGADFRNWTQLGHQCRLQATPIPSNPLTPD